MTASLIPITETCYAPHDGIDGLCRAFFDAAAPRVPAFEYGMIARLDARETTDVRVLGSWTYPPKHRGRLGRAVLDPKERGSFAASTPQREWLLRGPRVRLTERIGKTFFTPDIHAFWKKHASPIGVEHSVMLHTRTLADHWVIILALGRATGWGRAAVRDWDYLTTHFGAGARLLTRAEPTPPGGPRDAAVLDGGGKLLDVFDEDLAANPALREAVRTAARSVDRARGALSKRAPSEAMALWKGLVEGEYSLVDHFDTDGRRLVILRRNAPEAIAEHRLSRREQQVLTGVAHGLSNKRLAYDLGLAESTVGTLASRAQRKLGLSGRAQLIELAFRLGGQGG